MTRQTTRMFGIDTIDEYLAFCAEAVAELEYDQDSVLRAFAAILALNHIPDWLQYKLTVSQRNTLGLTGSQVGDPVKDYFEAMHVDFKRVRELANGFKHLRPVHSTQKVAGYGQGPYGIGPYGQSYLLIDLGEDKPANERWDVGLSLCKRALECWCAVLAKRDNHLGEN
ncbi:hypothetical protein [Bradyrhizobium diazoefficiens]